MTLFGEAEDGGNIRRTGSLYKPPSALLSTGKIFQSFISRGSIMLVERQRREWEYGHEPLTNVSAHYSQIAFGDAVITDAQSSPR
ncbi:hypothetical protein E5D57_005246 [Metarhizium anisopliae]|nr:hypothetical protein E5D57_005246 [Metarhizium anisopliae]